MSDNPLMNIGDLAKPATALIEKVAEAANIRYEPKHTVKMAIAEAEAAEIKAEADIKIAKAKAESEIEITDLHRRAVPRWLAEQGQQQESMENTITKAIPQLNEDADPNAIDDDWIIKFFDKCRLVTDENVQNLWASILAGEANSKGSYSPKALTTLADMNQKGLTLFNTFCSLCIVNLENPNLFLKSPANFFKIRDARVPIITGSNTFNGNFQQGVGEFAQKSEILYKRYWFGADQFQLLLEHGLIQDVNTHTDYSHFWYNDEIWGILKPDTLGTEYQEIKISGYSLSSVGKELFHITKRSNPLGHSELLINFLQECYTVEINRV